MAIIVIVLRLIGKRRFFSCMSMSVKNFVCNVIVGEATFHVEEQTAAHEFGLRCKPIVGTFAQVVKYAVATEDETTVYIKVAGRTDDGKPCLLNKSQFAALKHYVNEIKDAGVSVQLRNEEADLIRINLKVYYDPTLMNERGELPDGSKPVDEAVRSVITNLPFNGIYRNTDLLEAIKAIPAVVVVDINSASGGVQAKARNASNYTTVVGYNRPYSGYYEIVGGTANVIYEEYKAVE